ncbi:MAG: hypothetical protein QOE82_1025 [Thermoanaerobaculia bacterium]|jgi:hypothetical protein|nr:hypothetical protein [Thermoanaerobaculia bacterium]
MRYLTFALLAAATTAFAADEPRPPAYTADMAATSGGRTIRTRVWSDGSILKSQSPDGSTGRYVDYDKKLSWVYGPGFPCVQVPTEPEGYTVTSREEVVGSEVVDHHPVKKVKITSTIVHEGKTTTSVFTEWRATDLHDLALRRRASDGSYDSHLEHVRLGKPDAKLLAFPNPPCKYDAMADTTRNAPQAAGGFRAVSFFEASCKKLVALPLTFSIPSDYAIRGYGSTDNCFWGANDDLDRAITRDGTDFEHIRRGVFWCRVSNIGYDPVRKKFVSEMGTEDQWASAMKAQGLQNVVVTSKTIGLIPTARVTGSMNGQHVYMLYLAVPFTDSPAILINYHPAGKGGAADDAAWQRFIDSIAKSN